MLPVYVLLGIAGIGALYFATRGAAASPRGVSGDCINVGMRLKEAQHLLNVLGFKGKDGKKLSEDGKLGANTEHALRSYQETAGSAAFKDDGVLCKATADALRESVAALGAAGVSGGAVDMQRHGVVMARAWRTR